MLKLNFTPFPILETERLILRPITKDDAEVVFIMRNDAELTKYSGGPRAHTIEDAMTFIEMITRNATNNEAIQWGIMKKGEQKLAGSICYWNIAKEEDRAEVGYGLMHGYHAKGIMQEALQKVIEYGFETMKLKTIEAYTHRENERSVQLLERNNFKPADDMEARKEGHGDLQHMLIYVLKQGAV